MTGEDGEVLAFVERAIGLHEKLAACQALKDESNAD
jgi:hypothetical protein